MDVLITIYFVANVKMNKFREINQLSRCRRTSERHGFSIGKQTSCKRDAFYSRRFSARCPCTPWTSERVSRRVLRNYAFVCLARDISACINDNAEARSRNALGPRTKREPRYDSLAGNLRFMIHNPRRRRQRR